MERVLVQTFEVKYSDGFNVFLTTCYPDAFPMVVKEIVESDNKCIVQIDIKWS